MKKGGITMKVGYCCCAVRELRAITRKILKTVSPDGPVCMKLEFPAVSVLL
jgi:hypothetical protein